MRAPRVLLDLRDGPGLVVLGVRPLHRRRHEVVLTTGEEQQRGPVVVVVVDPRVLSAGWIVANALSQKIRPEAGMAYRWYSARDSSSLNVLVNV
jgi:hypothetical protein